MGRGWWRNLIFGVFNPPRYGHSKHKENIVCIRLSQTHRDLKWRWPQRRTTWKEDCLTGRQPQMKLTSQEDDLIGRLPKRKTTEKEDKLTGRWPHPQSIWTHRKTTLQEDDLRVKERCSLLNTTRMPALKHESHQFFLIEHFGTQCIAQT